ncbi:MAG: hypothetical protein KatS3mg101_0836 [Patescibacteria group bacterium]|nr:MAG: hypothetical protein KatS3mg101_0836 [Patescibacteria group bacterium]
MYKIDYVEYTKGNFYGYYRVGKEYKSITMPKEYIGKDCFTDGEKLYPSLKQSMVKDVINTASFLIKAISILNPYASVSSYSPGGIVVYGDNHYYIIDENGNAINLTTREQVVIKIFEKGFYIHPHVAKVYLKLWNILSMLFPSSFTSIDIVNNYTARNIFNASSPLLGILFKFVYEKHSLEELIEEYIKNNEALVRELMKLKDEYNLD